MKKLTTLLMMVLIIASVSESYAQRYGFKAGFNLSNMLMKDNEDTYSDEFELKPGFHVGAIAQFPETGLFSFESGLFITTKGMRNKDEGTLDGEAYKYKSVMTLYYIDIPLQAKASFDVGKVSFFGELGPYLSIGISGKLKTEFSYMGDTETDSEEVAWGSDKKGDFLKRLDYGITAGVGVVMVKNLQFGVSYNWGIANISTTTEGGSKIKNRVFCISIGYLIEWM